MTTAEATRLDDMAAHGQAAWDEVIGLCSGKRRWTMRVPAEPDHDSDLVIGRALDDLKALVEFCREKGIEP